MACEKHGMTNPTFCKYCDAEALEEYERQRIDEEHQADHERLARKQLEAADMEEHFRKHPHG